MISYDIYKNRIRRIAAVKNFIVRFRILFLSFLALVIGLISAFLITKGMITGELILPESIVYGEKYEVAPAKALFSGTKVEYAYLGKKTGAQPLAASKTANEAYVWSSELPALAGEYLARTVTDRAFGKGYGKPVRFEIQSRPVEFVIDSDSVIYGSNPGEYTFPLINGDRLQVEGLVFEFGNFETEITNVCANAQSFVILNAAGEDVTFCYEISTPEKEITLKNKAVTLAPAAFDFVYSGAPVLLESAVDAPTQTALGGDTAQIVTVIKDSSGNAVEGTPTAAGRYTVEIDPAATLIYNGETDVTARYDLTYQAASFTITPRALAVATASASKEYDGLALTCADFVAEGLAEGHALVAVSEPPAITGAGTLVNEYAFIVQDERGNDVTGNYAPEYAYGTLKVTPRTVRIQSASAEKIYDGAPLFKADGFTVEKIGDGAPLLTGDTVTVIGSASITYAGESGTPNVLQLTVRDENGNDNTANYEFICDWGALTVTKRKLTVTTATLTKEYDGTPLFGNETQAGERGKAQFAGIADGDIPRADRVASLTDVYLDGKVISAIANDTTYRFYTNREGFERETSDNYEVEYIGGELKVTPRPIILQTPDDEWAYDGTDHISAEDCEVFYAADRSEFGFVSGDHKPVITRIKSIRYVGSVTNEWEVLIGELLDESDPNYDFQDSDYKKYRDITRNYSVAGEFGTLTVTARPITIVTPTAEKIFNGEAFSDTEHYLVEGLGLPAGHSLAVKEKTEIPAVTYVTEGAVQNVLEYIVKDGAGNDVTKQFEIGYEYGVISRTRRPLKITTGSSRSEYDGKPLENRSSASTSGKDFGLVAGHRAVLDESYIPSVTYVTEGEVVNDLRWSFVDEAGIDRTENYEIEYEYGVLCRTARKLTVTTSSFEKIYDGAYLYGNFSPVDGTDEAFADRLVTELGDTLFALVGQIAAVRDTVWIPTKWNDDVIWNDDLVWTDYFALGSVPNETHYGVRDSAGVDRTPNYEIEYDYGSLQIKPKTIRVTTPDRSKPYDGVPLCSELEELVTDPLADGESLLIKSQASILDFGTVTNKIVLNAQRPYSDPILGDYIKEDSTLNYAFVYAYGTLEITKRDLTVYTATLSKIYDGETLFGDASPNEEIAGTAARFEGLIEGDFCEADDPLGIRLVSESRTNDTRYRVYAERDGEKTDITENYAIEYEKGELTITPRPITVATKTETKEYDGAPFSATTGWRITSELGLVGEHVLRVKAGTTPTEITNVKGNGLAEEGEQNVIAYEVFDPATDFSVSENYTLSYEYGYINRTPRNLVIATADDSWVYDGEPHEHSEPAAVYHQIDWVLDLENALVLDHKLKVLTTAQIVNAGTALNVCTYEVVDGNGVSVQYNYKILDAQGVYGTLEITKRPLKITTGTHDTVYDGAPMEYRVGTAEPFDKEAARGIVSGQKIALDTDKPIASVTYVTQGRIANELFFVVQDDGGNPYTDEGTLYSDNYAIEYDYGEIWRTVRAITIRTATLEKEYDGEELRGIEEQDGAYGKADFGDLADGDYPKENFVASMRDVLLKDGAPATVENDTTYRIFTDREGEPKDVSENYEIRYETGTLKITPRLIEVESPDGEWVYDGKEHVTNYYHVRHVTETGTDNDALKYGAYEHEILTVKDTKIKNVGTARNEFEIRIIEPTMGDESDYVIDGLNYLDVTDNYKIVNRIYGTLEVTKRPITLTVQDQKKYYDGTPLPENPKVIHWSPVGDQNAGLAEGQAVDSDSIVSEGSQTAAGESELKLLSCKIVIFDDNNGNVLEDTTANYEITYVSGKLIVEKRPITVTAIGQEKVYDGTPLPVNAQYRITTSVQSGAPLGKAGQKVSDISFAGSQTDAGSSDLNASGLKIVIEGESGETDVTENYDISYESGTLTVNPRPLLITTGSRDTVYDGNPMSHTAATAEPFHSAGRGIVEGHEIVLDTNKSIASVTYVTEGKVDNVLSYLVRDRAGNDKTGNYAITYAYGKLWRTERPITVTTAGAEKEYDGTALVKAGVTCSANGLAETDEAIETTAPALTDAGTRENDIVVQIVRKNGGKDVTENYKIEYEYGTLKVTPRVIEITTATSTFEYNGKPHYDASAVKKYHAASEGKESGLVLNHALKATSWTEITDAGERENVCAYVVIDPTDEAKDVDKNYTIREVHYGTLKVTPRKIVAVTGSTSVVYDGDPHSYTQGITAKHEGDSESGLVLDHKLVADTSKAIFAATNVRDTKEGNNEFECLVQDGKGNAEIGKNYQIVRYEYGTIEITPRPITVRSPDDEKEYDGSPLKNDGYTAENLVTKHGHRLVALHDPAEITNAGETENSNEFKIVAGEADVTENYAPTFAFGTLKITPRTLNVLPKALADLTYGDPFGGYEALPNNLVYAEGSKLPVTGETLKITVYYTTDEAGNNRITEIKNAGTYYVWIDLTDYTVFKNGETVASSIRNYVLVQPRSVSFEILKKELRVKLREAGGKVYDGKAYTFPENGFDFTDGTETAYGESFTLGVRYFSETLGKYTGNPIDAGTYTVSIDPESCKIDGSVRATQNYQIVPSAGEKYEIEQRPFGVTLHSKFDRQYNGEPFDYLREIGAFECEGLVSGDSFTGEVFALNERGEEVSAVYVGDYVLALRETGWKITNARGDVSGNYDLGVPQNGALKILPRKIAVRVDFNGKSIYESEYHGQPVFVPANSYASSSEDGGEGFVKGDEATAIQNYTYYLNGFEVEPIEPGRYDVTLEFTGSELLENNYEISYEGGGVLEVVKRHITVRPKEIEELEYDGESFDSALLGFDHWHTGSPQEPGFLDGDEQYYTPSYQIIDRVTGEEYDSSQPLQAGDYTVQVTLTIQVGFRGGYSIGYEPRDFYVKPRRISARVEDFEKEYDKKAVENAQLSFLDYYFGDPAQSGFVKNDKALAEPAYGFSKGGEPFEKAVNAGEYRTVVTGFTGGNGWIERNYTVSYSEYAEENGVLNITPRKLIIAPVKYSESLTSMEQTISLPKNHFTLLSGSLANGDKLEVYGDTVLRASEDFSAVTGIGGVSLTDAKTGENVAENYIALYEYDEENPDLAQYAETRFYATLSFLKRKVEILQKRPSYIPDTVPYEGDYVYFDIRGDGADLFTVLTADGLLPGHKIVIYDAYTDNKPGVTQKWIRSWEVVTERGEEVSYFYSVTVNTSDTSSHIRVQARRLNVTVAGAPSDYAEGDSVEILGSEGLFEYHKIEVTVADGAFRIQVYEEFELSEDRVKRIDRTNYYEIQIVQG